MVKDYHSRYEKLQAYIELMKAKAAEGHLSVPRQMLEMIVLWLFRGLGPGYYLFGRFWRREIPFREKLRHLGVRAYRREVNKINPAAYQKLTQHKVAEKALLSLFAIPTPKFMGFLHATRGYSLDGGVLSNGSDLDRLLVSERPSRICIKFVEGWGGAGFRALEVSYTTGQPELLCLADGRSWTSKEFASDVLELASNNEGYIIEEYLEQHHWYSKINPSSVNTVRIYARLESGSDANILGGYLRAGRKGAIADNATLGGVFFLINVDQGVLRRGRYNCIGTEEFSAHPDTGMILEGCKLPCWNEILALVPKVLNVFPYTNFAGLDIAVSPAGPVLIEMNSEPDRTAACDIDLPTLDMLRRY